MGAAEDARIDASIEQWCGVSPNHFDKAFVDDVAALNRRGEIRAGDARYLDACIVGMHHALVRARRDGRSRGEQADAAVPRGLNGRVCLGPHHPDHGNWDVLLERVKRCRRRGVAGHRDELCALLDKPR